MQFYTIGVLSMRNLGPSFFRTQLVTQVLGVIRSFFAVQKVEFVRFPCACAHVKFAFPFVLCWGPVMTSADSKLMLHIAALVEEQKRCTEG